MTDRVKVDWTVPVEEWDRFVNYVESKHGEIEGNMGREVERAMQEYADADEYASVEDMVDKLVQAAGSSSAGTKKRKNRTLDVGQDGDTVKVRCRVRPRVKDDFRGFAKQTEHRLGIALAHALQLRREGGRSERVERKLEAVVDEAEKLLATANEDRDERMLPKEKRTVMLCQELKQEVGVGGGELPDEFPKEALRDVIESNLGDSDYFFETYTDRVLDRLGYVPHPEIDILYADEDTVEEKPPIDRKQYKDLSREERVEGLRIKLGRDAYENGGTLQYSVSEIRDSVFEGVPTDDTVKRYMNQASEEDGYGLLRQNGRNVLRANTELMSDSDLVEKILQGAPSAKNGQTTLQGTSMSD